ncbi:fumarylacetoacetate hydrolase family protein [Evansella cellulosilytica]|uniref:Fumarylacetoacetate (FAA) hydrolase n=1 Tax=Evansella cellulosilytica (strain ATCC 21833 / DSM 2522 / FERM P-1141 / JCM 9156 / N-4) TaxID=649639 RepID=E6TSJ8_EVAC2|nr:fumarylacetoacetate hydrolase family protein [Evansella cellulosilytica]ADU29506.1 fumarylacetoacetate (FAA) hydrolase [Evansella cellulosilytica DSM 2522]
MKLATLKVGTKEKAALALEDGYVLLETINNRIGENWKTNILELIEANEVFELASWYEREGKSILYDTEKIPSDSVRFAPLYRRPRKIWGVGLNYLETLPDPSEKYAPPVSFMKPDTSIIGYGDIIQIPEGSTNTTAEAELAIIIGKTCKNIEEIDAEDYILGYTTSLDMTEADIHAENQRFLTRAKSFDTFFSFGPYLLINEVDDVLGLEVETLLNGEVIHRNSIANMRYSPAYIVSYHSKVMTLLPGDIIITGTPGPVVIRNGDVVEARITHFPSLINQVNE